MKQVTNDIRKDILVSLKHGDKRQSEIRKDVGIKQDNRSSLKYHIDYLMGENNDKFSPNPLIEEKRKDSKTVYTTNGNFIDYRFNTQYFLPYIYLAVAQMLIAGIIMYNGSNNIGLGYIASTFVTTITVSAWIAFKEDIREVYYEDIEPDRSSNKLSDKF